MKSYLKRYILLIYPFLIIVYTLTMFNSCEKELSLNLPDNSGQLVVEGWIEQGKTPNILLSISAPYFTTIDSNNIRDYAVLRAKVTVTNDTQTEILTLKPNTVYFPPYYYFGTVLTGKLNSMYKLIIENQGKIYYAITTIPKLVIPDSVWFEKLNPGDTSGMLRLKFTDDPQTQNYYRIQTKRLGKDNHFVPTLNSVFSDQLFNGEQLSISVYRGESNILELFQDHLFSVGDTIVLKFSSIDRNSYDFWHTIQENRVSSANPFVASEIKVISNIHNGLGSWCGYAVVYDTIIAK